jgi:hypothetical protein
MVRTQIQLPDEIYRRAKKIAKKKEISLAEVTRRGIELFLDRYPEETTPRPSWKIPTADPGKIKVFLHSLKDFAQVDEIRLP